MGVQKLGCDILNRRIVRRIDFQSHCVGEYCMTSVHRLGLLSLSVLLACGEEPQKIEPVVPEPNIELNVETVDFGELLIGSLSTESVRIQNTGEDT